MRDSRDSRRHQFLMQASTAALRATNISHFTIDVPENPEGQLLALSGKYTVSPQPDPVMVQVAVKVTPLH